MDRLRQWMIGRYGRDQLGIGLIVLYVILAGVGILFPSRVLYLLPYLVIVVFLYRFLSRDIQKRYNENQKFLKLLSPVFSLFRLIQRMFREKDTSKFYRCPKCHQMIRVPRKKGKIAITCPKCRYEFIKRT